MTPPEPPKPDLDELTELPTRWAWLKQPLQNAHVAMYLDIDQIRMNNMVHDYAIADEVIKELAHHLKAFITAGDQLYRSPGQKPVPFLLR